MAVSIFIAQNTLELEKTKMLSLTQVYCTFLILLLTSESPTEAPYSINDFLRDSIWDFLGVIISTILAILALYFGWLALQRKKLSYKIISKENVLGIHPQFKENIKVTFENKPIDDLFLVIIKFKNIGNIPILEADYAKTLVIKFGRNTKIFAAEIINQHPADLDVQQYLEFDPSFKPQFITFRPFLLNPKDSFTLRILVSDSSQPKATGRIAGVKRIELESDKAFNFLLLLLPLNILTIIIGLTFILSYESLSSEVRFIGEIILLIIAVTLLAIISVTLKSVLTQRKF